MASSLARPLLAGGCVVFVTLGALDLGFFAGAGGTFSDFLLEGAVRIRLGAGASALSGEAARFRAGWLRGLAAGFTGAFSGAFVEVGFADAARDDRRGGIARAEKLLEE